MLTRLRIASAVADGAYRLFQPEVVTAGCDWNDGALGCGRCAACKRNRQRATARTLDCNRPYLGQKTFAQLFPEPRWMRQAHGVMCKGQPAEYSGLATRFPPPGEE